MQKKSNNPKTFLYLNQKEEPKYKQNLNKSEFYIIKPSQAEKVIYNGLDLKTLLLESTKPEQDIKEFKTCTKCHIEHPISNYFAHPKYKDGYQNICKTCDSIRGKLKRELKKQANAIPIKPTQEK
jgi:superfamily II helicase